MSDQTKAALDQAIAAHFGDSWEGAIVTGYVLQMCGLTMDDIENGQQTSYFREVAENQPSHVTLGLLDYSHTMFRYAINTYEDSDG